MKRKIEFLKKRGITTVVVQTCQIEKEARTNPILKSHLAKFDYRTLKPREAFIGGELLGIIQTISSPC